MKTHKLSEKEMAQLKKLLETLDVRTVTEGDLMSSLNTLVAMACSVSNLAGAYSGVYEGEGRCLPMGQSLLVSAPESCGSIQDLVISKLFRVQQNWKSQLHRFAETNEKKSIISGEGHQVTLLESNVTRLCNELRAMSRNDTEYWGQTAFESPPARSGYDWLRKPDLVVSRPDMKGLTKGLGLALDQQLLIVSNLTSKMNPESYECNYMALSDGVFNLAQSNETVKAHFLITDPYQELKSLVREQRVSPWLGHPLWLLDGTDTVSGADQLPKHLEPAKVKLTRNFHAGLMAALGGRIHTFHEEALRFPLPVSEGQRVWMKFLRMMDGSLPGIVSSGRHLFVTLLFGLTMIHQETRQKKTILSPALVYALGKFLIHRMANFRNQLVLGEEREKRQLLLNKVTLKLENGPLTPRQITRKFNSMLIDQCRDLLCTLEKEGRVKQEEGRYALCLPSKEGGQDD